MLSDTVRMETKSGQLFLETRGEVGRYLETGLGTGAILKVARTC